MCVLIFSTTFVWNIFHSKKNWARYNKKCTVRSESRCAHRLRYVDLVKLVQACIHARGRHFQHCL
jgi:hypothetical protein